MPCGLALNIIMFKLEVSQDVNDSEAQKDWGMHEEPNINRSLKCVFTLTECVIGINIQVLYDSGTVKCNLAHA